MSGVQASHGKRLRLQLAAPHTAVGLSDLDIPGFDLYLLKGLKDGNAYILDYEDYH